MLTEGARVEFKLHLGRSHEELKTHLSYILHALPKNTQTNQKKLLTLVTTVHLFSRPKLSGSHQHSKVTVQTFSGGCDALGPDRSSLSPLSPAHEGQPQGAVVHISSS